MSATQVERASERELVIRRVFRARPQTVFDAMTKIPGIVGASVSAAAAGDCENAGTIEQQVGTTGSFVVFVYTNCQIHNAILDGQIARAALSSATTRVA